MSNVKGSTTADSVAVPANGPEIEHFTVKTTTPLTSVSLGLGDVTVQDASTVSDIVSPDVSELSVTVIVIDSLISA